MAWPLFRPRSYRPALFKPQKVIPGLDIGPNRNGRTQQAPLGRTFDRHLKLLLYLQYPVILTMYKRPKKLAECTPSCKVNGRLTIVATPVLSAKSPDSAVKWFRELSEEARSAPDKRRSKSGDHSQITLDEMESFTRRLVKVSQDRKAPKDVIDVVGMWSDGVREGLDRLKRHRYVNDAIAAGMLKVTKMPEQKARVVLAVYLQRAADMAPDRESQRALEGGVEFLENWEDINQAQAGHTQIRSWGGCLFCGALAAAGGGGPIGAALACVVCGLLTD
jgi:hypothetical protein